MMVNMRKDTIGLIKKCANEGLSQKETCNILGVLQVTLSKISKRHNISFVNHHTKLKEKRDANKGMLPICHEADQAERSSAKRHERQRETDEGVLSLDVGRAIGDFEQPRTPPFRYATFAKTKEAMRDQPKEIKYEIMYAHLLHTFEKKQIKLGLRDTPSRTNRPRQVITNSPSHRNFVSVSDIRNIRPFNQIEYDKIYKCINRGGRYTTTMIANYTDLSVSSLAWTLNIMFKDKLIDRTNERTTPIIGNAGPKSWRYVYFAK